MRHAFWLIVFRWQLERFADAEQMSPATIWRIYAEHHAYDKWVAKLSKKRA